ncbi:MAG: tetratricopeptide repeat protein [Pseudomonadota bacterium]
MTDAASLELAQKHLLQGKFASCEKILRTVIQHNRSCARAYYLLAKVAVSTGNAAYASPLYAEAHKLEPSSVEFGVDYAKYLVTTGDGKGADAVIQRCLAMNPDDRTLLNLSKGDQVTLEGSLAAARELISRGNFTSLLQLTETILAGNPESVEARHYYGLACLQLGKIGESISALSVVVQAEPRNADAWSRLGVSLMHGQRNLQSMKAHQKALAINPSSAAYHCNLGTVYFELGDAINAEKEAKEALSLQGDFHEAIALLGRVRADQFLFEEARRLLHAALRLSPGFPAALTSLAQIYMKEGEFRKAELECRKLVATQSDYADGYNVLIDTLIAQSKTGEALDICKIGVRRNSSLTLKNRLAVCSSKDLKYADAIEIYKDILQDTPDYFAPKVNLAGTYSQTGQLEASRELYEEASLAPEFTSAFHSNSVFAHLYNPESSAPAVKEITEGWYKRWFSDIDTYTSWSPYVSENGSVRVGMVSGDFRSHPVGYFLLSVLKHLVASGVEVYLYPTVPIEDETSEELKAIATAWINVSGESPEASAKRIHNDGIGILVDVSGHTAHNRLSVFARKPAPVQITWLAYLSTTGMDTMDYIIGDPWVTPEAENDHFTETPLVLPRTYQCLSKPEGAPDVSELPALNNGYLTFGSFNNYSKLNRPVIELWSKVLRAVPDSKLLLKNQVLTDPVFAEKIHDEFESHGVDSTRIITEPSRSREHILESYGRVDIGLDPFPYTGCTTSFESLWMGVPVLTKRGDKFLSHAGESIMNNVGLPQCVSDSSDDYVHRAVALASDLAALAEIRSGLRDRMLCSPLMDAASFADDLNNAFQGVWDKWNAKNISIATA